MSKLKFTTRIEVYQGRLLIQVGMECVVVSWLQSGACFTRRYPTLGCVVIIVPAVTVNDKPAPPIVPAVIRRVEIAVSPEMREQTDRPGKVKIQSRSMRNECGPAT
jgi:hypothetical protein